MNTEHTTTLCIGKLDSVELLLASIKQLVFLTFQMVGGDGTVYARLDLAARQASYNKRAPGAYPPRPAPRAEPSIYAFIDHTIKVDNLAKSNKNG